MQIRKKTIVCMLLFILFVGNAVAQNLITNVYGRDIRSLNGKWNAIIDLYDQGRGMKVYRNQSPKGNTDFYEYSFQGGLRLNVPGDWNSQTPELKYYEGTVWYARHFDAKRLTHKRQFLYFGAVSYRCRVYLNGAEIGSHEGGFTPFQIEVTDLLNEGENFIAIEVNNRRTKDAIPAMSFDWWNYGGITRDVLLVTTPQTYLEDYFIQLDKESPNRMIAKVALSDKKAGEKITVSIPELKTSIDMLTDAEGKAETVFNIKKLERWSSENPKLYEVIVSSANDRVEEQIGFRNITVKGTDIYLNGKPTFMCSISFHEEIPQRMGRAFSEADAAMLLNEAKALGVNMIRLAHYPQATYFYDLMDKNGIIVWAEIPFVGPGGYNDKGFVDLPAFRANGKEQLKELIRQHYNHLSICVWGLFNELTELGDNPVEYIKELNVLAHQEDTTRPTTSASNQMGDLNFITDAIAWNRYDGWYGGTPADLGKWLDRMHKDHPEICIAISEYGAGASIYHQQDSLVKTNPTSWWHPENWQTYYHIENWKAITERPFVWGSFVWNMFDFGAAHRTEGDRPGVNDKGLVTFDRKVRKDAFYFYKANWNKEDPMIYLIGKRNIIRVQRQQTIIAFSNQPEAELFVNGKSCGKVETDRYSILEWKHVILTPGKNKIEVKTTNKKQTLTDMYYCIL